jgi:hypothetical protein
MAARMICYKSKLGHSLSQISELTGFSIDKVKKTLAQATGLTPTDVGMILHMTQIGHSLEQIHQDTGVGLVVLKKFLPEIIEELAETHIDALADHGKRPYEISLGERAYPIGSPDNYKIYSRSPPKPRPTKTLPKPQPTPIFFYCCQYNTNKLHRRILLTGEKSSHEFPHYQFNWGCRWSELAGGSLLFTGGNYSREVVKIDALREYAVCSQPPMHTARSCHAAVCHAQYVYVLGMRECERYSCAESRWEMLPVLPVAGCYLSAVEVENSLYALGGYKDTVQKLSLDYLT